LSQSKAEYLREMKNHLPSPRTYREKAQTFARLGKYKNFFERCAVHLYILAQRNSSLSFRILSFVSTTIA